MTYWTEPQQLRGEIAAWDYTVGQDFIEKWIKISFQHSVFILKEF